MPEPTLSRRTLLAAMGAASLSGALAACGAGSSGTSATAPVSQADIGKAMSTPTELTFWTWVFNIDQEIALFEKKYPAIKVKVVNAGQGTPHYTKLRTALQAGTGAPDVAQIEFQYIPTFTVIDSLLDLRPHGASALKDRFVHWTWAQISGQNGRSGPSRRTPAPWECCTGRTSSTPTASRCRRPGTSSRPRRASCTRPTRRST